MYNLTKVKSWIKKANSSGKLFYDAKEELISDSYVIIRVEPSMKPAIMEALGSLDGTGQSLRPLTELPEARLKKLQDSKLKLVNENEKQKREYRVLYFPENGEKVFIDEIYMALFEDFNCYQILKEPQARRPVYVLDNYEFVGLIAPVVFEDLPESKAFEFKVWQWEGEQCHEDIKTPAGAS